MAQPGKPLCGHSRQEYKASGLQSNARSDSWSHYVQHGQRVWTHFQTFCQTLEPWYRQYTEKPTVIPAVQELVSMPWKL